MDALCACVCIPAARTPQRPNESPSGARVARRRLATCPATGVRPGRGRCDCLRAVALPPRRIGSRRPGRTRVEGRTPASGNSCGAIFPGFGFVPGDRHCSGTMVYRVTSFYGPLSAMAIAPGCISPQIGPALRTFLACLCLRSGVLEDNWRQKEPPEDRFPQSDRPRGRLTRPATEELRSLRRRRR